MRAPLSSVRPFTCRSYGKISAITALISVLLCDCTAVFVAPYDETTDRLLTDLTVQTQTTIARADNGQLSDKDREEFFDSALGTVRTLKARSSLFAKNEDEKNALTQLEQRYEELREHGKPPRTSLSTGLRATLLDLQQIQVAKKRSNAFTTSLKKSSSTP